MGKRHTKQSHKQELGQYFTTNSDYILSGFEDVVRGKVVIDPFAGEKDLLKWGEINGSVGSVGYDLEPQSDDIIQNDSIANSPSYAGMVLVSNPPFLSKNKFKGDKSVFEQWGQNDLYKCHLASLAKDCDEALMILPSNFLCESSAKARSKLFETHYIVKAKYWNTPVFEDATTGITVIHVKRGKKPYQKFDIYHGSDNFTFEAVLESQYSYLHGKDFFDTINKASGTLKVVKTDKGMPKPNTNIVVGLLDNGKWQSGLSYNEGDPIYCAPKSFTTYQLTLPDVHLSEEQQRLIVTRFNSILRQNRDKYHDMFLSNYMGPKQKILSRSFINRLLEITLYEIADDGLDKFFIKSED